MQTARSLDPIRRAVQHLTTAYGLSANDWRFVVSREFGTNGQDEREKALIKLGYDPLRFRPMEWKVLAELTGSDRVTTEHLQRAIGLSAHAVCVHICRAREAGAKITTLGYRRGYRLLPADGVMQMDARSHREQPEIGVS